MLDAAGIAYRYRDYTREPLSEAELHRLCAQLGMRPAQLLRRGAAQELGLDGSEPDDVLIAHMARRPMLMIRPIGQLGARAVVGRPPERLLELASSE